MTVTNKARHDANAGHKTLLSALYKLMPLLNPAKMLPAGKTESWLKNYEKDKGYIDGNAKKARKEWNAQMLRKMQELADEGEVCYPWPKNPDIDDTGVWFYGINLFFWRETLGSFDEKWLKYTEKSD